MADEAPKKKDFWDRFEIVIKMLVPLSVVGLTYLVSNYGERILSQREAAQLVTELVVQREASESSIRKDMFAQVIKDLVAERDRQDDSIQERVLNLELLVSNFHQVLDLRPLMEDVWAQLGEKETVESEGAHDRLRARLFRTVRRIARLQRRGLEATENIEESGRYISLDHCIEGGSTLLDDGEWRVWLHEYYPERHEMLIDLRFKEAGRGLDFKVNGLRIGPFDLPAIHNYRLSDGRRLAVYLDEIDYESHPQPEDDCEDTRRFTLHPGQPFGDDTKAYATLLKFRVLIFPGEKAGLRDRPFYEDVVHQMYRARRSIIDKEAREAKSNAMSAEAEGVPE
ncbi:MAG: hypothetical protein AAF565_01945 [Pseudomonadota bacterium]